MRENVSGSVFASGMETETRPDIGTTTFAAEVAAYAADPAAVVVSAMTEWELKFDTLITQTRAANSAEAAKLVTINQARLQLERIQAMDPSEMRRTNAIRFQTDDAAARSFRHQVGLALGVHEFTAARWIRCAEVLVEEFTRTLATLGEGTITYRHSQTIVETAEGVPEHLRLEFEARALAKALLQTPNQFERTAKTIRTRLHPETLEERHRTAMEDREAFLEPADDAMARYTITNSATNLYAVQNRITRIAQFLRDQEGETRTLKQLRSDVAAQLLLQGDIYDHIPDNEATGAPTVVDPAGTPQPPRAPGLGHYSAFRPTVNVTVPVLSLLGKSDEPATLDGYGPIPVSQAQQLAAVAPSFTRLLTHPETGAVLSVGRDSYRVPADLRRVVQIRDGKCRDPFCNNRAADCEIDHTTAWTSTYWNPAAGETSVDNLASMCKPHHLGKHILMTNGYGVIVGEAWGITHEKDTNGHSTGVIVWTTPTGHQYRSEPEVQLDSWYGIDPWTGKTANGSPVDDGVLPYE